jgi:hypothetical protein
MDNSINSLFSFDNGIYNLQDIMKHNPEHSSISETSLVEDENNCDLSLSILSDPIKSLDNEIEENALSLIEDIDIDRLRTNTITTLLDETLPSMENQLENTKDENIKQALTNLIYLLNENGNLVSLFQGYTNWLQKA